MTVQNIEYRLAEWSIWLKSVRFWPLTHAPHTVLAKLALDRTRREIAERDQEHENFSKRVNKQKHTKLVFNQKTGKYKMIQPLYAFLKEKRTLGEYPSLKSESADQMDRLIAMLPEEMKLAIITYYHWGTSSRVGARAMTKKLGRRIGRYRYERIVDDAVCKLQQDIDLIEQLQCACSICKNRVEKSAN